MVYRARDLFILYWSLDNLHTENMFDLQVSSVYVDQRPMTYGWRDKMLTALFGNSSVPRVVERLRLSGRSRVTPNRAHAYGKHPKFHSLDYLCH